MSAWIIAFFVAVGSAAWVYGHFMRTTGSNTKNSLVAAGFTGVIIFIAMLVILGFIGSWLG